MYIRNGFFILENSSTYRFLLRKLLLSGVCFFFLLNVFAQKSIYFPPPPKDTSRKKKIEILKSDSLLFQTQELGKYRKLIGNVKLRHENALMFCDSAVIDIDANYMTAFGKQVHIQKGDSVVVW